MNKIDKRFLKLVGLTIGFTMGATWYSKLYFERNIEGVLYLLIIGLILIFFTFKYLLPSLEEMKKDKSTWITQVILSLIGLYFSLGLTIAFLFYLPVAFVGGHEMNSYSIVSIILSCVITFYSFKFLTTRYQEGGVSNKRDIIKKRLKIAVVIVILMIPIFKYISRPSEKETQAQVAKIHATKITMDDVLGTNLPPRPKDPDKTVQGYDVNNNGIRDDVELDIWEMYPNSQKTRAVLLQYALIKHMELTQLIVNKETVTAVAEERSKAYFCISNTTHLLLKDRTEAGKLGDELHEFIQKRHDNTKERDRATADFYEGNIGDKKDLGAECDIDLSTLPD